MNKDEAIDAVHNGRLVVCSAEDYWHGIRTALQNRAGHYAENDDGVRMGITLLEVKRLDAKHRDAEPQS